MSQDEYHETLPGHADFKLPQPAAPVRVNGRRPIPETAAGSPTAGSPADSSSADSSPAASSQVDGSPAHSSPGNSSSAGSSSDAGFPGASSPAGSGPADSEPAESGSADNGSAGSGPAGSGPAGSGPAGSGPAKREQHPIDVWDQRVGRGLAFLRRRLTGAYEVDDFGFDPELADGVFHPLLRVLYRDWFRTEVLGIEHVPADGAALIVGNHSGTLALDALMLSVAIRDRHPADRHLRLLGADLVFRVPFVSELARKSGATVACNPDAERLMNQGDLVGVFPEGFKGIGKRFADRYKLQRFGRGGFVSAALRTGTPIVPVAIVGAEEIYPILTDIKPLARLLGLPYFPITPTFPLLGPVGLVPLPSKWLIQFGEPIPTAHLREHADDPMVVYSLADQVRETIQATLHELLEKRPDPFGL